jgi:hypothetical protein
MRPQIPASSGVGSVDRRTLLSRMTGPLGAVMTFWAVWVMDMGGLALLNFSSLKANVILPKLERGGLYKDSPVVRKKKL